MTRTPKTDGTLEEKTCLSATKERREWPEYQTADGKILSLLSAGHSRESKWTLSRWDFNCPRWHESLSYTCVRVKYLTGDWYKTACHQIKSYNAQSTPETKQPGL